MDIFLPSYLKYVLFGIFIRDLPKTLRYSSCRIYANDTQIHHHFKVADIYAAIARVQTDTQAVADWATANGVELNEKRIKMHAYGQPTVRGSH